MQGKFSALMLLILFFMLAVRTVMLRRRGVRAIVFAETNKSDYLLALIFLSLGYAVLARGFALPLPAVLGNPFWTSAGPGWAGLILSLSALIGFALTLASFGNSFRVGIDEKKPDGLVTEGAFSVSRNPVYLCFLTFFGGLFLANPTPLIAAVLLLLALAIHRQILREEDFLKAHYGAEYLAYCRKVRRYL